LGVRPGAFEFPAWIPRRLPETVSRPKPAVPRHSNSPRTTASHAQASAETISPMAPSVAPISITRPRAPVAWWREAVRVVKERTHAAPTLPESGRIDLHIGSPGEAPAHHAGESYRDELGATIVWVSDKCYIESDPPLPGTPPALRARESHGLYVREFPTNRAGTCSRTCLHTETTRNTGRMCLKSTAPS
jgi:hypothetical protein